MLVVSHDNHNYSNLTYDEAKALEPALLTFGEVIEIAKAMSIETGRDIGIIPETKSTDYATSEAIIQQLIEHDFTDPDLVIIQSFSATNLQMLNDTIMPQYGVDIPLAYLGSGISNPSAIAAFADIVAPSVGSFTAADVAAAHAAGLEVTVWTILGAQADIQTLIDMGVDAIFVDDTKLARTSIEAIDGATVVYGTTLSDVASGSVGNDVVYAMQGDDIVRAKDGEDLVYGDGGDDVVFGGTGNDILVGGSGTDFLSGDAGTDVLDGGAGNDVVVASGDTVLFRPGSGIDLLALDAASTITFQDIASGEIIVLRVGADLIVRAGDDALVIRGGADDAAGLPGAVTFADGVTLTGAELAARATSGTDADVAAALPGLEALLADAPSLAVEEEVVEPTNLIVNGGFEDLTGADNSASWGYRNTSPAGVIAGWVNTGDTRAEVHKDTVGGVSAAEGTYWFDLEGAPNNAKLVQTVAGVETGATYQLTFSIADTDTAQASDTDDVYWGGQLVYTGIPKNKWQEITIDVIGGAGDGSNTLIIESATSSPNGAGVALDDVSLIRIDENPNLIVNGSFEDLTGATDGNWSGDWGYRNDSGVIAGWTQVNTSAGGRAELHFDTQNGISADDGNVWFDLDGYGNNAKLVQTVAGVEAGATYRLTFYIADADARTTDDGVRVYWGGQIIYEGVPVNAWQKITIDVGGGAGDGTNQLIFEGSETSLNGYGAALDDISLRKIADASIDDDIVGTAGDDTILAGDGDDTVAAGAGNDTVDGGTGDDVIAGDAGDDLLVGGAGDDDLDGGEGTDTASYAGAEAGVEVDLAAGTAVGDGDDTLSNMEVVIGSIYDDVIAGDDAANTLDGLAGDDTIDGGAGDDVISGGAGNDILAGGAGDDLLRGGAGNDSVDGGAGFDTLDLSDATGVITLDTAAGKVSGTGIGSDTFTSIEAFRFGAGNDVVTGGNGDENFDGGAGNDTLKGGAGDDQLAGGDGNDTVDGGSGDDVVAGGAGDDILKGGSGDDTVDGGDGVDNIDAGSGDDIVSAGAGNDIVVGGSGDDVITGGAGDDVLSGGSGHDVFVFAAGFGKDIIKDFGLTGSSSDVIEFSADLFDDFAEVMSHATQSGADVLITVDADTTLTLANIKLAALATDDFRFA